MRKKTIVFLLMVAVVALAHQVFSVLVEGAKTQATHKEVNQFLKDIKTQDKYHQLLRDGDRFLSEKNYSSAESNYLLAFKMAENTSLEGVSRGALMRLYEDMKEYQKALQQLDWILVHMNANMPQYEKYQNLKRKYMQDLQ